MPIYRFGVSTDPIAEGDLFDPIATDFRSDFEQRHTQVALHDPESGDLKQARKHADEIINVSGAEVKVFIRTDNSNYDPVWDADPDPTYWDSELMKAFFKPQPLEMELKKWGVDVDNRTEIVFSHHQVYSRFGERMLRIGDVIQLPYNAATPAVAPKNYRVTNAAPSGNFRYNWLYFTCAIEVLTADVTVRPPGDQPMVEEPPPGMGGGTFYEGAGAN